LLNIKRAIFQKYHQENKKHSVEMMMTMFALY